MIGRNFWKRARDPREAFGALSRINIRACVQTECARGQRVRKRDSVTNETPCRVETEKAAGRGSMVGAEKERGSERERERSKWGSMVGTRVPHGDS